MYLIELKTSVGTITDTVQASCEAEAERRAYAKYGSIVRELTTTKLR